MQTSQLAKCATASFHTHAGAQSSMGNLSCANSGYLSPEPLARGNDEMRSTRDNSEELTVLPDSDQVGETVDASFAPPRSLPPVVALPSLPTQRLQDQPVPLDLVEGAEFKSPKASWFWMRNSAGEASASLTFATFAFCVVTIWILLSIFETITIGGSTVVTRPPPGEGMIVAYLGTSFSLYFGRRYSDRSRMAIIKE